ncbi:ABC transporter substrate-binding protein [Paenibacillus sp. GCM10012303]|uniref:ABC transporter substrate-binding protein n=1 Tax=Paenibacillus sp. GCM10012303 TaxID=3317340 RepID=UPI0036D225C0
MSKSALPLLFSALSVVLILSGCSKSPGTTVQEPAAGEPAKPAVQTEPVTVTIGANPFFLTDEELKKYVADPVKKKYPHITVVRSNDMPKGTQTVEEMVVNKNIPDILVDAPYALMKIIGLGVTQNMDDLIRKHQFDKNRLLPELIDSLKTATGLDYMVSLPFYNNAFGLFYNADLFDKFAVSYPTDKMTWEEIQKKAVQLTREEGDKKYIGLWAGDAMWGGYQLGLPYLDKEKKKAMLDTEDWRSVLALWKSLYDTQGALMPPAGTNYEQLFFDGQVAIAFGHMGTLQKLRETNPFNWNVFTYPSNNKAPGFGQRADTYNMLITQQSKNKDAAFQVISVVLSDEVQLEWSRNGKMSVLKDTSIHNEFGKAITAFQNKNVAALTKAKLQVIQPFVYDYPTLPVIRINTAFNEVLHQGKDINTALREANELMEQDTKAFLK